MGAGAWGCIIVHWWVEGCLYVGAPLHDSLYTWRKIWQLSLPCDGVVPKIKTLRIYASSVLLLYWMMLTPLECLRQISLLSVRSWAFQFFSDRWQTMQYSGVQHLSVLQFATCIMVYPNFFSTMQQVCSHLFPLSDV